ncbi:hypothetical protein FOA52_000984 [Chlamydomonas sp. UWO 241]|nr:hypothetical protein FOA52_000984 [Chlamydomonas sp. UWO 241]
MLVTIMAMQDEFGSGTATPHGDGRSSAAMSRGGGGLPPAPSAPESMIGDGDKDLEIQVLLADREVLQDQVSAD